MSTFRAINPATGAALEPAYHATTLAELDQAAARARAAFPVFSRTSGQERGAFLRAIAVQLEARASELIARAGQETALPPARLQGETARTCSQLRLFAELIEEGSWVEARLDRARERENAPRKPDLRSMLRPIGPVAVFGASNFPLAFSVAGGDTASALAAGNPVIVKAHPAHPGTSALAGEAIAAAVRESKLPEGVFSLVFDAGIEIGAALVEHPAIRAVGFTGSQAAGRHLMDLAAKRPEPIPVFAEMGSTNPVFILPRALATRGPEIARGLHGSVTLGAGQFCTKPGLVMFAPEQAAPFVEELQRLMSQPAPFTLLTPAIAQSYRAGAGKRSAHPAVEVLTPPPGDATAALLLRTDAATLLQHPSLGEELFGPATLLVRHAGKDELLRLAASLHGHLTATVHAAEDDLREYAELIPLLATKVGRVLVNGFPTGVEVTHAMVHSGPYPAASFNETSVGTRAILRFARPVCFQDVPELALPPELHAANPLKIWRQLEGKLTQDPLT